MVEAHTASATWFEWPGYICLTETMAQNRPQASGGMYTLWMPGTFMVSRSYQRVAVRLSDWIMWMSLMGLPTVVAQNTGSLRCRMRFTRSTGFG